MEEGESMSEDYATMYSDTEDGEEDEGEDDKFDIRETGWSRSKIHLYCEVCDTTFSSSKHLQAHFAGTKHRKALEKAGLSVELTEYIERPKNLDIWNTTVKCLLCKVMMLGCDCLIHAKSDNHTHKLSIMTQRNRDFYSDIGNCFLPIETEDGPKESKGRYFCEQCELELSGKEHLELHVKGKKHQQKARWLYIDKKSIEQESRRVWCTLCKMFVNSIQELEMHFTGRTHIRMLKRRGVKYEVLVDQYGEDRVGGRPQPMIPKPRYRSNSTSSASRHSDRDRSTGRSISTSDTNRYKRDSDDGHADRYRHASDHDDGHASSSKYGSHSRHSSEDGHGPSNRTRSRSPRHNSSLPKIKRELDSPPPPTSSPPPPPVEFTGLHFPKWSEEYAVLPEYNPSWPAVLREGREHHPGAVIYQKPLLAVGDFASELLREDPRLEEERKRVEEATQRREREKEREERRGGFQERRDNRDRRGGFRGRSFGRRDSYPRDRRDSTRDNSRRDLRRSLDDNRRRH